MFDIIEFVKPFIDKYRGKVFFSHQEKIDFWPLLSGYDFRWTRFEEYFICIFEPSGRPLDISAVSFHTTHDILGHPKIEDANINVKKPLAGV